MPAIIPRLKVWKLREPNVKPEFAQVVAERKNEVFESDSVESKWNAIKDVCQKATEQVYLWTKGPGKGTTDTDGSKKGRSV